MLYNCGCPAGEAAMLLISILVSTQRDKRLIPMACSISSYGKGNMRSSRQWNGSDAVEVSKGRVGEIDGLAPVAKQWPVASKSNAIY